MDDDLEKKQKKTETLKEYNARFGIEVKEIKLAVHNVHDISDLLGIPRREKE